VIPTARRGATFALSSIPGLLLALMAAPGGCAARGVRPSEPKGEKHMKLADTVYTVSEIFRDEFDSGMEDWVNVNPVAKWAVKEGKLWGKWGTGGSTVWLKPVFEGDVMVVCRAESLEPGEADWKDFGPKHRKSIPQGGKNLNLFFLCSGPGGENMVDCAGRLLKSGSGPNGMGEDQYNGYFLTWTLNHARFRQLPGYACVSEWRRGGNKAACGDAYRSPENGMVHEIVALRHGQRIRYLVDGRLIHDVVQEQPRTRGQMGFALWRNLCRIHSFRVYRIDSASGG